MKKLLIIAVMSLLLTTCSTLAFRSPSTHHTAIIQTTTGQELIDLQAALDSGAITQEEYDELKLKIIERLDAPMDSTNTCN